MKIRSIDETTRLKIKNFVVKFVLPRLTNRTYEDRGFFASYCLMSINIEKKFDDFEKYLEQEFQSGWFTNKKLKTCPHSKDIFTRKSITLLDLLIFEAQHGYFDYGNSAHNYSSSTSFYIDRENHLSFPWGVGEDLLGGNLIAAVRGVYNFLNIKNCLKYDCDNNPNHSSYGPIKKERPPHRNNRDFKVEYWELQATQYFGNYAPLTNKGCHSCKIGYTPNKECWECRFFEPSDGNVKYHYCAFDYWEKYGYHHASILPDDGKTYACENFLEKKNRTKDPIVNSGF